MKLRITILIACLSLSATAYSKKTDDLQFYIEEQKTDENLIIRYHNLIEMMLEKGLAEATDDGPVLSQEGETIFDKLRKEGRLDTVKTAGGSICW